MNILRASASKRCRNRPKRDVDARSRLQSSGRFAPTSEDVTANGEAEQWPPHVDANQRPGIRFKCREYGDRRVLHKDEGEPACERGSQSAKSIFQIQLRDQQGQSVIDNDGRDESENERPDAVCSFDVSRFFGVKIEPGLTPDCV